MKCKVIVLGVGHSNQLVTRECQPAVYRAFFDHISPAVIGIERAPMEYNRSDFYEFTYEQQNIILPYARENNIPVRPFDWTPSSDDQQLAWNISDFDQPPFVRGKETHKDFIYFSESSIQEQNFFFSETDELKRQVYSWINEKKSGEQDFPRRLFLYRTFMQAMRIKHIAKEYIGETVLIVVGHMHKNDIEEILKEVSFIELAQSSAYEYPSTKEIEKNLYVEDLYAIANFNLLGVQSKHFVDFEWLTNVVNRLDGETSSPEVELYKIRLDLLTKAKESKKAINEYQKIINDINPNSTFHYNGLKDKWRLDSYYDPFGNLTILHRVYLELAREYSKINSFEKVEEIKELLSKELSSFQRLQLNYYWDNYLIKMY